MRRLAWPVADGLWRLFTRRLAAAWMSRRDQPHGGNRMKWIERLRTAHGPGLRVGQTVVTLASNAHGAPFIDEATATTDEGTEALRDRLVWTARGRAVSLVVRRDRYGARLPGRAVFVGRIIPGGRGRRSASVPLAGDRFHYGPTPPVPPTAHARPQDIPNGTWMSRRDQPHRRYFPESVDQGGGVSSDELLEVINDVLREHRGG